MRYVSNMLLDVKCQVPPCWGPTPPPGWLWVIYLTIAIVAGLVILVDWRIGPAVGRSRARTAVWVWLASVAVLAVSAEALELYRYSITPR